MLTWRSTSKAPTAPNGSVLQRRQADRFESLVASPIDQRNGQSRRPVPQWRMSQARVSDIARERNGSPNAMRHSCIGGADVLSLPSGLLGERNTKARTYLGDSWAMDGSLKPGGT